MTKVVISAFVALLVMMPSLSAQTKYGVVNTETILKELPAAIESSKKLEAFAAAAQDTLRMMQKDFESRIEQYQKQQALMSAEAKKKEEESLQGLRMRFLQYQEEKLGAQGEVSRLRESYLKPIRDKVAEAIAFVAKEEKVNLVLDKVSGVVLFSEDKADLTYKVLDRMKRGEK